MRRVSGALGRPGMVAVGGRPRMGALVWRLLIRPAAGWRSRDNDVGRRSFSCENVTQPRAQGLRK